MGKFVSLEGQTIGRWTVLQRAQNSHSGRTQWMCRCECGTEKVVVNNVLMHGKSRSCGCLKRDTHTKHGHAPDGAPSRTYRSWHGMIERCTNPKKESYRRYGARGIVVCDRWLTFTNFLADMGERPARLELDRIANDGPYSPDNCRWATRSEQSRNTSVNHLVTFQGQTLCVAEWAERLGLLHQTITTRLARGWSVADALSPATQRGTAEYGKRISDGLKRHHSLL